MEFWGYVLHQKSKGFSSLRVLHHSAVVILELLLQLCTKRHLNLSNPYLRSAIVLLDSTIVTLHIRMHLCKPLKSSCNKEIHQKFPSINCCQKCRLEQEFHHTIDILRGFLHIYESQCKPDELALCAYIAIVHIFLLTSEQIVFNVRCTFNQFISS